MCPECGHGHNDQIAWGFTNTGPDVMDLYIERVNPDNPNQYEVNGEWVDFETRTETIQCGGWRSGRDHGSHPPGTARSCLTPMGRSKMRSTQKIPEAHAIQRRSRHRTARELCHRAGLDRPQPIHALRGYLGFQQLPKIGKNSGKQHARSTCQPRTCCTLIRHGNIGYQMPGDIPIRAGGDGRLPVPGWTDEYEWTGFIPFEELPYAFNPDSGYIATANNQVHPRDYPYLVTTDWSYGFRADTHRGHDRECSRED